MMDATPNTFDNAERVHEIYSLPEAQGMLKKVKLIVILRDPIDRELSAYNHKVFDYKADGQKGFVKGKWYNDVVHINGTIKTFTEYGECLKKAAVYILMLVFAVKISIIRCLTMLLCCCISRICERLLSVRE